MRSSEIWRKYVGHGSSEKKDCEVGVTCVREQREAGQSDRRWDHGSPQEPAVQGRWVVERKI